MSSGMSATLCKCDFGLQVEYGLIFRLKKSTLSLGPANDAPKSGYFWDGVGALPVVSSCRARSLARKILLPTAYSSEFYSSTRETKLPYFLNKSRSTAISFKKNKH
jgi:hypothetical protein